MKLNIQLKALRVLWAVRYELFLRSMSPNWDWPWKLRCDGYAPIGNDSAQYCFRLASHRGPCLAQIDADHKVGAAEFMPDKRAGVDYTGPYSTCRHCHKAIHLLRSPSGEWWAHNRHPADGHDAEPESSWRVCPQCGRYTAISHRSRWCVYDGDETPLPHWCCSREECDAMAVRAQAVRDAEELAAVDLLLKVAMVDDPGRRTLQGVVPADDWPLPPVEIEQAEALGLVVRSGYPDEEPGESPRCRCPFLNNPPCSNCEDGLVDPDAEVRP